MATPERVWLTGIMTIRLTESDIAKLQQDAADVLDSLITSEGIYASSDAGWMGPYHSWFGRDSAIVTDLVCAAYELGGDKKLAQRSLDALLAFGIWQGKRDSVATGEEKGKMPHEIRTVFNDVDRVQHAKGTNHKPWFIDKKDGFLKNWDSVDSTPLWVIAVIRGHKILKRSYEETTLSMLRSALEWILGNLREYNGLLGFTGADLRPQRSYSGLHNQGWKDSYHIYQHADGSLAEHPIKEVLANAEAWLALQLGAKIFGHDEMFSSQLIKVAARLKEQFNSSKQGFLLPGHSFFAQAIEGNGKQLRQVAIDVPACLWASVDNSVVIDEAYIDVIAKRVMNASLFTPYAGIRNYEVGTSFPQGTLYHGSDHTYWPFMSALVARGLWDFDYKEEAVWVVRAYLSAVKEMGSNLEMFIEDDGGDLISWHHPILDQESAHQQAWTAAAVYYGATLLSSN